MLCIKDKIMETIMKNFERFAHLMENGAAVINPYLNFETVCRVLKESPSDLNDLLLEELGYSGDEIIASYRGE